MSGQTTKGSQWWLAILAFLAGMAVYAGASSPRPQVLMAEPSTTVAAPAAAGTESPALVANADTDTCSVQLD